MDITIHTKSGRAYSVEFDYATDSGPTFAAFDKKGDLFFCGTGHDVDLIRVDLEDEEYNRGYSESDCHCQSVPCRCDADYDSSRDDADGLRD